MTAHATPERRQSDTEIAAAILLAGGMHPPPMARASGGSLLDLFLTEERSALGVWQDRIIEAMGDRTPIRLLCNGRWPTPSRLGMVAPDAIAIDRERNDYRGPAGAVRDHCLDYPSDSIIVVADAGRCYLGSMSEIIESHLDHEADVTIACDADRAPAGVYVFRVGVFELAPENGFIDLKEQMLSRAVKAGHRVRAHILQRSRTYPLRTRKQ
ncbi:MAG: hypothetical protein VYC34_01755, partial [Planctomycetota bacterium]|nr:hypothetical protein [Planctomycetota bacterium]